MRTDRAHCCYPLLLRVAFRGPVFLRHCPRYSLYAAGVCARTRGKTLSAEDNAVRQKKVEENILHNVTPLRVGRSVAVCLPSTQLRRRCKQRCFCTFGGVAPHRLPKKKNLLCVVHHA